MLTLFYEDHESPVVIGHVYTLPEPEPAAHAPTAQLLDELLSVPVSSAPPTASAIVDIANFDIGFHISDVDSDSNDHMDTSADMFL